MEKIHTRDIVFKDILPIIEDIVKGHLTNILGEYNLFKRSEPEEGHSLYYLDDQEGLQHTFDEFISIEDQVSEIIEDVRVKSYALLDRDIPSESVILKRDEYKNLDHRIGQVFSVIDAFNKSIDTLTDMALNNAKKKD